MARLHRYLVPAVILLLFAALWSKLLLTPVSVETTGLFGRGRYIYQRGWPFVFLETQEVLDYSKRPWQKYEGGIEAISGYAIAADAALAIGTFAALVVWLAVRTRSGWRLQFSLRTLALAVLLIAATCGWVTHVWRSLLAERRLGENLGLNFSASVGYSEYCGPEWLRRLIPEDKLTCFSRAVEVRANFVSLDASDAQDLLQCIALALDRLPYSSRLSIHALPESGAEDQFSKLEPIQEVEFNEGNEISSALIAGISRVPHLRVLNLSGCFGLSDLDWTPLANLKSLETLVLNRSCADDETIKVLAKLPNLRMLNLRWTDVTDDSIESLRKIKSLVTLHLGHTKISENSLRRLIELPNLRLLYVPDLPSEELTEMFKKKNIEVHSGWEGDDRPGIPYVGVNDSPKYRPKQLTASCRSTSAL
jgi:hypothetical protein